MHDCDCELFNFLHKSLATTFKLRQQGKDGNMYVPLQVGVFFLLLFFLKVASFACIDGMCSNFILQVFSFFFRGWGRVLIRFSVAASRVSRREDVLQRYYEILLVTLKY